MRRWRPWRLGKRVKKTEVVQALRPAVLGRPGGPHYDGQLRFRPAHARMQSWSALVVAAACAILFSCGGDAPASSSNVFKIGVVLPLTGSTAWGGRPARIAAELAAREVNEQHLAGDYRLELEFADGTCAPRTAYAAADKLISQDGVGMLIGEWCSSASIAAAQVANDAKVPMLVQISTADGIARRTPARMCFKRSCRIRSSRSARRRCCWKSSGSRPSRFWSRTTISA